MGKKRKRTRPKSRTVEAVHKPAEVVDLDSRRALAVAASPPQGRVVPRQTVNLWDRAPDSELTFSQVASIIDGAKEGTLEPFADLTRRMLQTDAHLKSVVETRTLPVAGARWELAPAEVDESDQALAKLAADFATHAMSEIPHLDRTSGVMLEGGNGNGYAASEIIWARKRGAWMPSHLDPLHPRRFRYSDTFELALYDDGRIARAVQAGEVEGKLIPVRGGQGLQLQADKFVVFEPMSVHDFPSASGLYMTCARAYWIKSWVQKYWLGGAEIGGNPRLVGTLPQNADQGVRDELFNALEDMAADGILVVREGTSVDFMDPTLKPEVWQSLFQVCNEEMSKAWLGSTLNVEVGDTGGNRALGESQADTTIRPRLERDGRGWWEAIERDLLTPLFRFNAHLFGGRIPPMPRGRFILVEEQGSDAAFALAADHETVRNDEVRVRAGLEPLGGEWGSAIAKRPVAAPSGFGMAAEPVAEVATSDPFPRPWDQARRAAGRHGAAPTLAKRTKAKPSGSSGPRRS